MLHLLITAYGTLVRLEFSVAIGVLRTWMGERPSLRPARMTPSRHKPENFAAMHSALVVQ
jgi:hypothetical protein